MLLTTIALAAALYQPVRPDELALHIRPDNSPWIVAAVHVTVPADGLTLAWDLAPLSTDASRTRISIPPSIEIAWSAVRGSSIVVSLLPADGSPTSARIKFSAPVRDLKARVSYRVAVKEKSIDWTEILQLSDWKGQPLEEIPVIALGTEIRTSLNSGRTVSLPIRTFKDVAFREVVRWDSKNASAGCQRTLILERSTDTAFGRQGLPAGDLTVMSGHNELTASFPGATPGETVEVVAGRVEGVTVERLRAASKQINVREDVHRRLAAYDEQIDYEYAILNTSEKTVSLEIVEHPARGWKMKSSNYPYRRKDADTLIVSVSLKPGERAVAKVTVVRANQLPS